MTSAADSPGRAGHRVEEADVNDASFLSSMIAGAFSGLAVSQWLVPDPGARQAIFPGYFRMLVEHALASGVVLTTPARDAAALWIPVSSEGPPEPPSRYRERLAGIAGSCLPRFLALDEELERHHPYGRPHEHLAILAVHPNRQRLGIGSALLQARHARLDRDRIPAYLEASDPVKADIYRAHGYVPFGENIQLPDGPAMHPMIRFPGSWLGPAGHGQRM